MKRQFGKFIWRIRKRIVRVLKKLDRQFEKGLRNLDPRYFDKWL